MLHGTLTLLTRALREDAQRGRAHAFRFAGSMLILIFLIVAHALSGGVAAPGRRFFELISWLNLGLIVLAGASYFATTITEEKEQGTLGLLQLAGVSPLGLLLGKSTSRLISVLLVFLGQLPFALLAITLGGVTVRQIIAVDIALAAFLVLVANLGLLSSVLMPRSGGACAWVLLFLGLLLFGVHYGNDSLTVLVNRGYLSPQSTMINGARHVLDALIDVSIITRLDEVLQTGFEGSLIGRQAWCHVFVGGAAFLLSWLAFNRFTRYSDVATPARGWLPRRRTRWKLLVGRAWKWALVWKDYHFIAGGHALALFKLIGYPLLLWVMWRNQFALYALTGRMFPELSRVVMLIIIGGEACVLASRMFHEELKWGTLPNLAVLPQPIWRMAYGKAAGCLLGLAPAAFVLLGLVILIPARSVSTNPDAGPMGALLLMETVVLLHLTVLYSLIVAWGALALAAGTLLILNALLSLPFSIVLAGVAASAQSDDAVISPIVYFGCMISAVLQVLIVLRIRQTAAR
ncbi:MAG: hypothetical protein KF861_18130 [Planctomycetaceae bacterium]|nr:hypothetical protein [Planctomycetaceae bacterium]